MTSPAATAPLAPVRSGPVPLATGFDDTADDRWARWRASALAQDVRWAQRAIGAATLAAAGVAFWLAIAIYVR
jgi:hypothetical protein